MIGDVRIQFAVLTWYTNKIQHRDFMPQTQKNLQSSHTLLLLCAKGLTIVGSSWGGRTQMWRFFLQELRGVKAGTKGFGRVRRILGGSLSYRRIVRVIS